eukprot:gene31735-6935_t
MSQDTSDDPRVAEVVKALEDVGAKVFFEKALTSSDVGGTGRVVIPKAIAEQYFPRLDNPSGLPSRMYLLEGAGELHRAYNMSVGDVMVFAQKPDGGLVIAGRPATRKAPIKRPNAEKGDRGPRTPREAKTGRRGAGDRVGGVDGRKRRKSGQAAMGMETAVYGIFLAIPNRPRPVSKSLKPSQTPPKPFSNPFQDLLKTFFNQAAVDIQTAVYGSFLAVPNRPRPVSNPFQSP